MKQLLLLLPEKIKDNALSVRLSQHVPVPDDALPMAY